VSWNYRIMRHSLKGFNDGGYGLHEVYYDEKGQVEGWSQEPETGFWDSVKDLRRAHAMMLKDAMKRRKVLVYSK